MFVLVDKFEKFVTLRPNYSKLELLNPYNEFWVNYTARQKFLKSYGISMTQLEERLFQVDRLDRSLSNYAIEITEFLWDMTKEKFGDDYIPTRVTPQDFYFLHKKFPDFSFWTQCMRFYYSYEPQYRNSIYWDVTPNNRNVLMRYNKPFAYDVMHYVD